MIISTTPNIEGKKVIETLGIARGNTVRSRNVARDIFATLGLNASYDDLRTDSSASSSLKKQAGTYNEIATNYSFTIDKRDRAFMPTRGHITSFRQELPIYADKSFIDNPFLKKVLSTILPFFTSLSAVIELLIKLMNTCSN